MAKPFVSLDTALDRDFVLSLCQADRPRLDAHYGPSFLGADVGAKTIIVEIGHHDGDRERDDVHWVGEVASFDELYDLGARHHVSCGVIDAMAETRSVMDFCARAPWGWGARYTEDHNPEPTWHGTERTVRIPRTASLDDSHLALTNRKMLYPRREEYLEETWAAQMVNLARVQVQTKTTQETGRVRYAWHVRGTKNDHQRHAANYLHVAASRVGLAERPDPRPRYRAAGVTHWQAA